MPGSAGADGSSTLGASATGVSTGFCSGFFSSSTAATGSSIFTLSSTGSSAGFSATGTDSGTSLALPNSCCKPANSASFNSTRRFNCSTCELRDSTRVERSCLSSSNTSIFSFAAFRSCFNPPKSAPSSL